MAEHATEWITFDDIFGACPSEEELKAVVSTMNFEKAIYRVALINGCASANGVRDHKDRQALALRQIELTEKSTKEIDTYFRKKHFPWVLHRRGLLELLKWIAHFASDQPSNEKPDEFLLAQMAAAELSTKRHDPLLNGSPGDSNLTRIKKCLPVIREWALMGLPAWYSLHSLGRASLLLLDRIFVDPTFGVEFGKRTDGLTLSDFYACVAGVACLGLGSKDKNGVRFTFTLDNLCARAPDFRPILERFFKHFSIDVKELREELRKRAVDQFYDFKLFRSRPILRLPDGHFIILDQVFFQDMMAYGPLFKVLGLGVDKVFGKFGEAFENYCQTVFANFHDRMSGRNIEFGHISTNRKLSISVGEAPELSDIILTYPNTMILIETKGAWLKDDTVRPFDYELFWQELMDKYGVPADAEERDKGIAQLANSIKRLAEGHRVPRVQTDTTDVVPEDLETIFPLLLVHDALLPAQGFAITALASEFAILLGQPDAPSQGYFFVQGAGANARKLKIMNLIVLTITDLEHLAAARINNKSFLSHLRTYSEADPLRMKITFDLYINQTFRIFEPAWYPPAAPAIALMKAAGERLLPPSD